MNGLDSLKELLSAKPPLESEVQIEFLGLKDVARLVDLLCRYTPATWESVRGDDFLDEETQADLAKCLRSESKMSQLDTLVDRFRDWLQFLHTDPESRSHIKELGRRYAEIQAKETSGATDADPPL